VKNTKCPFAAHIRKMRPRADLYIDRDDSDDSDDEEVIANKQVINSNVIIRRSITFGPEVDEEKEKEETKERRGIYFLCYQSSIRNGFNFLVTRKSFLFPLLPYPSKQGQLIMIFFFKAGQATKSFLQTRISTKALVSMLSLARGIAQTIRKVMSVSSINLTMIILTSSNSVTSHGLIREAVNISSRRLSRH